MSEFPRHVENDLLLLQPYSFFHAEILLKALQENQSRLQDDFPARVGESPAKAAVERFIEQKYIEWQRGEAFCFGIWHKGEYIGEISLKYADQNIPCGEFSYFVLREYEGKGHITSSVQLLLPFAFDRLQLRKLQIRCSSDNVRSRHVAVRSGFVLEGILRDMFLCADDKTLRDMYCYGMTANDYRSTILNGAKRSEESLP